MGNTPWVFYKKWGIEPPDYIDCIDIMDVAPGVHIGLKAYMARMHAPTLGNTLGITFVLCASALVSSALQQRPVIHELLITFFLIVTSPITAIVLMQAGVRRDPRQPVSEE